MDPVASNTRQKVSGVYVISTSPPLLPAKVTPLSRLEVQERTASRLAPAGRPKYSTGRKNVTTNHRSARSPGADGWGIR